MVNGHHAKMAHGVGRCGDDLILQQFLNDARGHTGDSIQGERRGQRLDQHSRCRHTVTGDGRFYGTNLQLGAVDRPGWCGVWY